MVQQIISTAIGKVVKRATALRGGGSALPGLVVEKIDPKFLSRTLAQLPLGVVIISGTNGKTTTTKVVVELLESAGLKVFTNRTGSNFSRGIASALLGEINNRGKIDSDIAVLELDEAWAAKFVDSVKPSYSLILNVLRDQLDRFGEIDSTAKLLQKIAGSTTTATILNKDDPRVQQLSKTTPADIRYFGTTDELLALMPTDDGSASGDNRANNSVDTDVLLQAINGSSTPTFLIDGQQISQKLELNGVYNMLNAAAALCLVKKILSDNKVNHDNTQLVDWLSTIRPAFGRGETIELGGVPIELILVKNPSGFRLALMSFTEQKPTMIAINDNYADGRDMSWLWDVDFSSLSGVDLVTGSRAHDMALRLQYDLVDVKSVSTDLVASLSEFIKLRPDSPKKIFCTYTAMTAIRRELSKITDVEKIS